MKKVLIGLLVLLMLGGVGGSVYFGIQWNSAKSERDVMVQQNGMLQSQLDSIGAMTTVYTVTSNVTAGKEITKDDLIQQSIPQSSVTDSFITDETKLLGKFFRINMTPGTSITTDVVMEEKQGETLYHRDIGFQQIPIGLRVGDYFDLRVVLPYGEEFIVLEHKRVYQRVDNTVTVKLSESELALFTSLRKDVALYSTKGLFMYAVVYDEPGTAKTAIPFYPVRKEMEAIVTLNPNITDKKRCINAALRDDMEVRLLNVLDKDAGALTSGSSTDSSQLNAADKLYIQQLEDNDYSSGSNTTVYPGGDPTITPPESTPNPGDSQSPGDSQGNGSHVTDGEVEGSKGDDLFSDEEVIQ